MRKIELFSVFSCHSERSPKGEEKNLYDNKILRSAVGLSQNDRNHISRQPFLYIKLFVISLVILTPLFCFAANEVYTQTDWSGGASTANAVHPTDKTGWNKYSSKDANINTSQAGKVILSPVSTAVTETTDTDFNAGVYSHTEVIGTGASAAVKLTATVQDPFSTNLGAWQMPAQLPVGVGAGGALCYPDTGDFIYAIKGHYSQEFLKYSIPLKRWYHLAKLPKNVGPGADLAYYNGFIYCLQGNGGNAFWRYEIATDTWAAMAVTPETVDYGGKLVRVVWNGNQTIFATKGGTTTTFWAYNISTGLWASAPNLPRDARSGSTFAWDGGNYLYYKQGEYITYFYRLNLTTNIWSSLTDAPGYTYYGSCLVYPGSGDYLYLSQGGTNKQFWKYSITGGTWQTVAHTPGDMLFGASIVYNPNTASYFAWGGGYGDNWYPELWEYNIAGDKWSIVSYTLDDFYTGGSLCFDGATYIYGLGGNYGYVGVRSRKFYRYSTTANVWTQLADAPNDVGAGGCLTYAGGYVYALRGGTSTDFWRYNVSTSIWESRAFTPAGGVTYGGALVYSGTGDYIYALAGGNTNKFWQYTISIDTWTALAVTPQNINQGADLIYYSPGTGDYIYCLAGNAGYFFRYSVGGGTWETLTACPENVGYGGNLAYPGSGNYIYATVGSERPYLLRFSISGNSWEYLETISFYRRTYDGSALEYGGNNYLYATRGYSNRDFSRYSLITGKWDTPAVLTNGAYRGASLAKAGNYFYCLQGNYTKIFLRYSLTTDQWEYKASLPKPVGCGGSLAYTGGDFIYAFSGSYQNNFYRYTISTDTWTELNPAPNSISQGGSLVWAGGDELYALRGGLNQDFYRYTISTGVWDSRSFTPATINYGSALLVYTGGDYIFCLRGTGTNFWRFSISTNMWSTTMSSTPATVEEGSAIVYPGSGDYIYCMQGDYNPGWTGFWRYSITGNSWSSLACTPIGIKYGSALVCSGNLIYVLPGSDYGTREFFHYSITDNLWSAASDGKYSGYGGSTTTANGDIYLLRGDDSSWFYRYSTALNTWTTVASFPGLARYGAAICYVKNSDYIYALRGNGSTDFYRYSIANNTWQALTGSPVAPGATGSSLAYPGTGDFIYALRGGGNYDFYRYSISNNSWETRTSVPGAVESGGELASDGGDYLYTMRGYSGQEFYRYSISGNSWSNMANTPASVRDGGTICYPGFGDFIYALRGYSFASQAASTDFWRYSISANNWEFLNSIPIRVTTDASLVYPGGNYLYALPGYNNYVLRYLLFNSGTFTSQAKEAGKNGGFGAITWSDNTDNKNNFINIKARTANDSAMSSAVSWSSAPAAVKGADLSTYSSVSDGNSYLQYQATFLTSDSDVSKIPQLNDLTFNYDYYPQKQELISSAYNSTTPGNRLMKLYWNRTLPQGTDLRFQLRTAPDSAGAPGSWGSWIGPLGTTFISNDFSLDADYSASSLLKLQSGNVLLKKELEDFQYKQTVTIDNSAGGVQTNVVVGVDFPVSNNLFWSHVQSSGNDLRFYDGTQKFAYKLVNFDYTRKSATLNVKIPTLAAGETKTIYLLYGSANALSEEDTTLSDVPRNGLKGWWKFDETSGTSVADSSGNSAGGNFISTPLWVSGKSNNALQFDGIDDFVTSASAVYQINGAITLGMWIKPNLIREQGICGKYDNSSNWTYRLYMNSTGNIVFERGIYGSWTTALVSNTVLKVNEWYYINAIFNSAQMKIYINNTLDKTVAETRNTQATTSPFVVGTTTYVNTTPVYNVDFPFSGIIDNVCVFNRAVTGAEQNSLYNGNSGIVTTVGSSVSPEENTSGPALGVNWPYRRKITVANPSADNLTGHQVGVDFSAVTLNSATKAVASWHFNEGSGQTVADSSGTNPGTLGSTTGIDVTDPTWTTSGKYGNALQFDGVDDYVNVGNNSSLSSSSFTYSFWMKRTGAHGGIYGGLVEYINRGSQTSRIMDTGSTIVIQDNGVDKVTSTALASNQWYHITLTFNGTTPLLYVNGTLNQTGSSSAFASGTNNIKIGIGADWASTYYFNGVIDEVRIYNRALSAQEILDQYNANNSMGLDLVDLRFVWVNPADSSEQVIPHWFETDNKAWIKIPSISAYAAQTVYMYYGNPAASPTSSFNNVFTKDYGTDISLVGAWHMDAGSGTSAIDSSGKGNNGTLTNGPVWQASDGGQWGSNLDAKFSTGSSLQFVDGVDDYVNCGNGPSLSITNAITIEAWIKPVNGVNLGGVVWKGSEIDIAGVNGTSQCFYLGGVLSWQQSLTHNLYDGNWHHVVWKYDKLGGANNMQFYIDGVVKGQTTATGNITSGSANLIIGKSVNYPFNGSIDEVQIYSRALSVGEIQAHYQRRKYASPELAATLSLYTEAANAYSLTNYNTVNSVIQPIFGAFYNNDLAEFQELANKPAGSDIKYQVSPNGYRWYWWNGANWAAVTGGYSEANTASTINSNLAAFMTQVSTSGEFFYRAYLHSDTGTATPSLDQVKIATAASTSYYIDPTGAAAINILNNDAFNDQWFQYKAILYSSGKDTPILDDVTLEYITALILITSPNTAVTWQIGSNQNITWTTAGLPAGDTIKISYSIDAGSNWKLIAASVTAANGTYPWTVPEAQTAQGRIRVVSNSLPAVYDISDVNFTIGGIKITAPNSGETWEVGTTHNITWTTVSTVSNQLTIEYSKDNFATATLIADQQANDGVYSWSVPNDVSNSVKIRIRDIVSPFASDTSDLNLRIQPVPQITVNVPNGGESWQVGTEHQISWTANASVSNNLKLEYSKDDFVSDIHEIKSMQVTLSGWNYSIPVTINNSTNTNNLTDYPVKINIDSTLSSFWNHVKSDGSDIRLYDYNPSAILPYYLGIFDYANKNAEIYVKLPLIPASSSKIISLSYGNPSATSQGNFDNVFNSGYPETGLAGGWHFSEGKGTTVNDDSGNNNNGTLNGGAVWTNAGKFGSALSFDGVDDYVESGSSNSLDPQVETIEVWVYPTAFASTKFILGKAHDTGYSKDNILSLDATGKIGFDFGNGSVVFAEKSNLAIGLNVWSHITIVRDLSMVKYYINGVLDVMKPYAIIPVDSVTDKFTIGWQNGGNTVSRHFQGYIDEVRIYNRALSEEEIQAHYQRQKSASPEPTVSFGAEKGNVLSTPTLPYYKVITINNSGTALTDYQFKIALDSSDTSFWSHVKLDGGDIRIYDDSAEFAYWIESFNYAGKSAVIWVKLLSVAATSTKKIYLYYGSSSLTTLSNYDNVFTKDYGDSGLAGLWHMDAGVGNTVVDASGNGNNGTLQGRVGLSFDGTDDYVNAGTAIPVSNPLTIGAWVKVNGSGAGAAIAFNSVYNGGYYAYSHKITSTNFYYSESTGYGGQTIAHGISNVTQWHYWVTVRNGTSLKLYVDGNYINTASVNAGAPNNSICGIGFDRYWTGSVVATNYFNGSIDDVRFYNRELSAAEVTEHYNGIYSDNTGLVGNWQMNDGGSSQTVADSSGNGNNATRGSTSAVESNDPIWLEDVSAWQAQDGGQWGSRSDVKFNSGSALQFDGMDDYVNCGNSASLNLTSAITLEMWFYPNAGTYMMLLEKYGWWGWTVRREANNSIYAFFRDPSNVDFGAMGGSAPAGSWYHCVVTYDKVNDDVVRIYLNGTQVASSVSTGGKAIKDVSSYTFNIATSGTTNHFNGIMDEVRVYNRALSVSEIQAHYQRSKYASTVPTYSVGTEQANTVSVSNFLYNKLVTIDNSGNTNTLTDYQVKITLNNTQEFFWSHVKADGSDIRFYDGATELSFWFETFDYANKSAVIWVKVPSIPASLSKNIKLYYGNFSVASASSFNNVFTKDYGDSGLAGVWHLDEGAGLSTADVSGNSNTGTLINGPVWQAQDGGYWGSRSDVKFSAGSALQFDGTDDYLDLGKNIVTGSITYTFWIKTLSNTQQTLFSNILNHAVFNGVWFKINDNGTVKAIYYSVDFTRLNISTAQTVNDGNWHQIVFSWTGDTTTNGAKIYIDGIERAQGTSSLSDTGVRNVNDHIGVLRDASAPLVGNGFNGSIDEVRMYNRVLSADEIRAYYQRRKYTSPEPTTSVEGDNTANGSVYLWTVPDDVSSTVKVRITDNNRPTCTDKSDNNFSITQPVITVTSPNGAEVWVNGDTHNITWTKSGTVSNNLLLEYSKDNFVNNINTIYGVFLPSWPYYKAVTIDNTANTNALVDYQVAVDPGIYDNTGLVGSWHFSEGSGNSIADMSGQGNKGTLNIGVSGTQTTIAQAWTNAVSGRFGSAMNFDGSDDYVDVGDNYDSFSGQSFTMELWMKANNQSNYTSVLAGKYGNSSNYYYFSINAYKYPYVVFVIGGVGFSAQGSQSITDNNWHHIVYRFVRTTNTTVYLYVDGALATQSSTGGLYAGWDLSPSFVIGRRSDGGNGYKGLIDEVKVYNRALSPTEIQQRYNSGSPEVRHDYQDIRFTDFSGVELPYWQETDSKFWVKVNSIPASSTKTINMYYGNPSATGVSNGTNTFDFFDDFEDGALDAKWTYSETGTFTHSERNGFYEIYGDIGANPTRSYGEIKANSFVFPANCAVRLKYSFGNAAANPTLWKTVGLILTDNAAQNGYNVSGNYEYIYSHAYTSKDANINDDVRFYKNGTYIYDTFPPTYQSNVALWMDGSYFTPVEVELQKSGSKLNLLRNGAIVHTDNAYISPFSSNPSLILRTWVTDLTGGSAGGKFYNISVRKYVSPEPACSLAAAVQNISVISGNSYSWTVPNDSSSTVKVRITDSLRPAVKDTSDNNFQILGHSSIALTSPNGNETLIMGDTHNITWISYGAGVSNNLKLEYSIDNGSTWALAADQQVNDGTYTWTVPNVETTQGLVRITDNTDALVTDTSDAAFTITIPTIIITSPNGAETWYATGNYNITWTSVGSVSNNLKLEYTTNGSAWTQISTTEANDGAYSWTIPDVASSTCKVRITDNTRVAVTDSSNANFSILAPTITITSPNGAEEWGVGTAHDITWTTAGTNNSIKNNLSLQYSKDNFAANTSISTGQTNDGAYSWTIPDDVSATVKVKIFDASRPATVDTSNANFSITQPYVRITSPNGGESWVNTTQHNITWVSLGTISNNLALEYSKDNFVTPISIATGETNDGTYAWTVPDDVSATVKVRITDLNRPAATDLSDASFSIAESILTVTRPNGAELFTVADAENITWTSTGTVNNNLKLEYSKDNFASAGIQIAAGLSNNGTYSWTVPVDVSATVRVRITDSSRLAVWDKSNADFTILPVPQITVVTPNGGQTWMVGSIYTISWSDNGGLVSNNLTIQYSSDGGAGWTSVSSGEANDGSLAWTIPDDVSTNCKARIYDASRPTNSDVSDSTFTIANPLITVTSPNGGEAYAVGDAPVITWATEGAVSNNLTLEYTTNGTNFNLIKSAQANTGSFTWTVPDVISSSVKIRITDGNRPASNDLSNNNFTLMQYPALTVSAPNGNEVYIIGDVLPVTWTYKGLNIQPLTISYSSDNFVTSSVIATGVTHTLGSYNWTIPNNAFAVNTLKVKIYDPVRTVISDTSDANFRIKGGFTITAPVANAVFIAKKAETISWTTRGIVANVKLEYSIDNGISWNTIIPSVANTGTYSWAVADNRTANYTVKVRVSDPADSTIEAASGAFKIDYYTISWRVMDYDTSASLPQLSVKDSFWNDQSNTISSPVEHDYPYGAYTTFWKKEGYIDRSTEWTADSEKIVTIYLENQITASVEWHVLISNAYNADSDTLKVSTWLERRGKLVGATATDLADLQSAAIEVHDGISLVKTMTTTTHDNQGVFWFNWSNTKLEGNRTYFIKAAISFRSVTYTSGASIDITSAKKMLDEKLQLQTIQTQVDTTRVAVDNSAAEITTKIDATKSSIENRVTEVKDETAKILTAAETTIPKKVEEARQEAEVTRKSEILNRDNVIRLGQSLTMRYRTYSRLNPSIDVYNASNILMVNKGTMTEIGTTGIYEYLLKFEVSWGRGDFTIVCSESTKGTMDALIISVIRSDIDEVSGQVSAVLGTTSSLQDIKNSTDVLNTQFNMIESALAKINKDVVGQVKDMASSAAGLEAVYTQLVNISKELQSMGGSAGIDLEKLLDVSEEKNNDLVYLKNKTQELKSAMEINNKMLQNVSKKPVVQTWFEFK